MGGFWTTLNFTEIAKEFNITASGIRIHYIRALRRLGAKLREYDSKPPKIFKSSKNFRAKKVSLEEELKETETSIKEEIRKLEETPLFLRKKS